ncbi:MAG: hypothetical protein IJG88_00080 [Eggerthellaceae bacterium]|nr:hypothetical protein [Eggerthellaceae bacterium]
MPVSDETVLEAAMAIATISGLEMDPDDLLEDAFLLARSFPEEDEFMAATAATVRAIGNLAGRRVTSARLKYAFEGWLSYHYQHRVSQGGSADCRIVFRETEGGVEVKAFGHRRVPADIYERMATSRQ